MRPRHTVPSAMAAAAFLATAVAGCGGSSDAASGGQGSGSQGSGGQQGGSAVTITEPKNGATVTLPFTVKFSSSQPLGPTDSGKDHVHVFLDGKSNEYTVVTTTSYEIKNAPAGKHTVDVTLQHADHSPVGPKAEITVNVSGGSGGSGGDTGGGGGYGTGGDGY